jgi:ubiquinol-cytochrome c reductase cytochrome b subunit
VPVDYRKQYKPKQLEPIWPNGLIRGAVASLCTLAVMVVLAVLPVILEQFGLAGWMEELNPADPHVTPEHIRPEWYFLANYQSLKMFPGALLGISGATLAVILQALVVAAVLLLPFWARRRTDRPPGWFHGLCVTVLIAAYVGLMIWGAAPLSPLMGITVSAVVVAFALMMLSERRRIRRIMGDVRDSS